jgi:hypothetical protein
MKKLLFVPVLTLAAFGAGCNWRGFFHLTPTSTSTVSSTSTAQQIVPPSQATNPSSMHASADGWQTFTSASPAFSFRYPAFVQTSTVADRDLGPFGIDHQVFQLNLGTLASSATAVSVPMRGLFVAVVSSTDPTMQGCYYSPTKWPTGFTPLARQKVTIGGTQFCLTKESEGATGHYVNSFNYAAPIGNGKSFVVFRFAVLSDNCGFYTDVSQCVAYDEARDTADFASIVGSLHQP